VCAFANDLPNHRAPGVLYVGVEDNGTCSNLTINDDLLQLLGKIRDDGAITPFPTMEVRRATIGRCTMAVVIAYPSDNPPVRFRGRAWIRVGPRRAIATPEEERRLVEKRRWGNLPLDAQPVTGSTLDDLDLGRFRLEYVPSLISVDTIAQNQRTIQQQLRALRLVNVDEADMYSNIDWQIASRVVSWSSHFMAPRRRYRVDGRDSRRAHIDGNPP